MKLLFKNKTSNVFLKFLVYFHCRINLQDLKTKPELQQENCRVTLCLEMRSKYQTI